MTGINPNDLDRWITGGDRPHKPEEIEPGDGEPEDEEFGDGVRDDDEPEDEPKENDDATSESCDG